MCCAYGSLTQAITSCPMCKVFPYTKCPHQREICKNRTSHPRFDVLYLKNAEVDSFNGCGYCKWARTNPPPKQAGPNNPGWPGCCRPPSQSEFRLIQAADWRSVSIVHHVSIPPDVKAALDSLRASPVPGLFPPISRSSSMTKAGSPHLDRRHSGSVSSVKSTTPPIKAAVPQNSPVRRSTGSPQQMAAFLGNLSRSSSGNAISSSVPTSSNMDQVHIQRRQNLVDSGEKREGTHSSNSSPNRKNIDLDGLTPPRRSSSARRPTLTQATAPVSVSHLVAENRPQLSPSLSMRRRASVSSSQSQGGSPPKPAHTRGAERPLSLIVPRVAPKGDTEISSASSSSGSEGLGSITDSTVTSDGGFTDYLSDESEAELQRQAEARAALVAQNQAEELEFRAARLQLAHVGLRPPKSWNSTNPPNISSAVAQMRG